MSSYTERVAEHIRSRSASWVGTDLISRPVRPAVERWVVQVRNATAEAIEWAEPINGDQLVSWIDGSGPGDVADDAPPAHTQTMWDLFMALAPFQRTPSDSAYGDNITYLATIVLRDIALEIVEALINDALSNTTEEEEN